MEKLAYASDITEWTEDDSESEETLVLTPANRSQATHTFTHVDHQIYLLDIAQHKLQTREE